MNEQPHVVRITDGFNHYIFGVFETHALALAWVEDHVQEHIKVNKLAVIHPLNDPKVL